jgi:glycerophosphoryl diester phosphodiesterase
MPAARTLLPLLALFAGAVAGGGTEAWRARDHLRPGKVVIQGHRGVGHLAEENTVEAFELGWRLGVIPEADLRMTRDGVIVPFHDATFARVVKDAPPELQRKGVQDVTYAELAALDVGAWKGAQFRGRQVVPMGTIFARMAGRPERRLYLDIKSIEFSRLAEEVRRHDLTRQVILASRKVAELRAWRALVPEGDTLLWMHGNEAELRRDLEALQRERFAGITQLQVHVYPKETNDRWAPPTDPSPPDNPFRLRNAFLREVGTALRAHGVLYQAFPYTAAADVYGQLLDLGVMSFATDHPDVAVREVDAYLNPSR